uniref:Uncharacterized protein n=1 Tax=Tetradesmus obliquus TaxID=3088 RepID=A0A383WN20_TETOB
MQAGIRKYAKAQAGDAPQQPSRNHGQNLPEGGASKGSSSCGQQQGISLLDLLSNNKQTTAVAQQQRSGTHKPTSQQQVGQQHQHQHHVAKKPRVSLSGAALTSSLQAPAESLRTSQAPGCDLASYLAAVKLPAAKKQQELCKPSGAGASVGPPAAVYSSSSMVASQTQHTGPTIARSDSVDAARQHAAAQQACRKQQQRQRDLRAVPVQNAPHQANAQAAGSMQSCPLCGVMLPQGQLQQHVDAELQELEDAEAQQQQQQQQQQLSPYHQPRPQQHPQHVSSHKHHHWQQQQPYHLRPPLLQQQQQQQQQHLQRVGSGHQHHNHWQQQQQEQEPRQMQWQQPSLQQSWGQPVMQPTQRSQQPQQHQAHGQQQAHNGCLQQQPRTSAPTWQPRQQQQHQPPPARQQQQQKRRQTGLSRGGRPSRGAATSSSSCVQGLRLAPSRQQGPSEAPAQLLGSFDHWGDSASNWMDDGMIGLEGAPQSAAECWEGIGSCAIGSRRLG